ncbi:Uma2 family endonuclease [Amycolatopsis sp. lyj-112]|uniref:Uma2 family endonuclease n=1 Tax=Amycolatopsis sp. lyj-112 TaxID=2789288 RepID=UPI00397BA633
MTVMTESLFPRAGSAPLTVRDLEGLPEDGRRYELVDGTLIVSPAPGRRHQKIGLALYGILEEACPPQFDVLAAPFAVHIGDSVELQPDVLVGWEQDFTEKDLPEPPVLAVEVLSPSTALYDLNTKKAIYQRVGVPYYWVIDPDGPELTVFELDAGGEYRQVLKAAGDEPCELVRPFPVSFLPSELG